MKYFCKLLICTSVCMALATLYDVQNLLSSNYPFSSCATLDISTANMHIYTHTIYSTALSVNKRCGEMGKK